MKNSDLRLDDDVRTLLEQELDADVPDPNSPEFQAFLEELQVERPELFDEVMRGLQVNVTLPAEQQAQRAARREGVNQRITRAFFQRSKIDGEAIPAKRRIMTYILGTAAFLLPVMYVLAQAFQNNPSLDAPQEQAELFEPEPGSLGAQGNVSLETPTEPEVAIPTPEPRVVLEPEPEPEPEPPAPRQVEPPAPPQQAVSAPRPSPLPSPAPSPAPPAPSPTPPAPQYAPTVPEAAEVPPSSLEVYRAQRTLPATTSVYQASQPAGNLQVYQQESVPPASLNLPVDEERSPALPQETVLFDVEAQAGQGQSESNGAPVTGGGNTGGQPAGAAAASSTDQRTGPPTEPAPFTLPLGSRIQATLATGIYLAEGAAVPIVALTQGDWCTESPCPNITWIGQARLDVTNRVQVSFNQAIMDGSLQDVSGLALNPDSSMGLRATLRDEASLSAENLLRNGVAGVSDYVDALVNQKNVTYAGNGVIVEDNVPEVDAFIAGRIADLFDSPVARGPTIRIAEIPSGTPLLVLFGVGAQTGAPQN